MRKIISAVLLAASVLSVAALTSCKDKSPASSAAPGGAFTAIQLEAPKAGDPVAVIRTSMGDIKVRLFPEQAPKAVENFTKHAEAGYYDGIIFHRVIQNFMIQTGDPLGVGVGGESIWGKPFADEFHQNLRNFRGALSMANSGANTNGSQFFIVQAPASTLKESDLQSYDAMAEYQKYFPAGVTDKYREVGGTPWLDYQHTVFGQVYEGMDVVDAIAAVKTQTVQDPKYGKRTDVPVETITINTITVTTAQ